MIPIWLLFPPYPHPMMFFQMCFHLRYFCKYNIPKPIHTYFF
jgi:hypothetical protein